MSRNTLIPVVLLALVTCTVLSAGDVYTGVAPTTATYAFDKRTDLEKLEDRVNEMAFHLDEALYVIDANEERIDQLESALAENQAFTNGLKDCITINNTSMTLTADRINLNTLRVAITAPRTTVDGVLECDKLKTDSVDADSYTPGAGNIW